MTPGESAAPEKSVRRAAFEVLELDDAASPEATRAALLRWLAERNFYPDPVAHEAALVVAGCPTDSTSLLLDLGADADGSLSAEVEAFAAHFFRIPLAARRNAWQELQRATEGNRRLRLRLQQLEPGLAVDPAAIKDRNPLVEILARDLLELFVVEPKDRAVLAREKAWALQRHKEFKLKDRNRASRELKRRHPELAAMAPAYVAHLAVSWMSHSLVWQRSWVGRLVQRQAARFGIKQEHLRLFLAYVVLIGVGSAMVTNRLGCSPTRDRGADLPGHSAPPLPIPRRIIEAEAARQRGGMALRVELNKVGARWTEGDILQVLAGLLVSRGAAKDRGDSLATALASGSWDHEQFSAGVAAIRQNLGVSRISLTPEQIEVVARETIFGITRSNRSSPGANSPGATGRIDRPTDLP